MRIEFYGVLTEAAGVRHMEMEVTGRATVQDILDRLQATVPGLERHLPRVACAVGDDMVTRGDPLEADATLVLLPPVSGG